MCERSKAAGQDRIRNEVPVRMTDQINAEQHNIHRISGRTSHTADRIRRRIACICAAVMIAAAICILLFSGNQIQAGEPDTAVKLYTSIRINPGDSLWSIAVTYMDGHYSSPQEYINELKFINNLSSDTIYADAYLLVAYYAES